MRIAIICEGSSDYPILKSIVDVVLGQPAVYSFIQPDFDALQRREPVPGPGWQGVRNFLKRSDLDVTATIHDIIIVQVDADLLSLKEITNSLRSTEIGEPELQPLCDLVKSWAGRPLPEATIITLPRQSIESWLIAAHTKLKSVEEVMNPAQILQDRGLIDATTTSLPEKAARTYTDLSRALKSLISNTNKLAREVPELARFVSKIRIRVSALRKLRKR